MLAHPSFKGRTDRRCCTPGVFASDICTYATRRRSIGIRAASLAPCARRKRLSCGCLNHRSAISNNSPFTAASTRRRRDVPEGSRASLPATRGELGSTRRCGGKRCSRSSSSTAWLSNKVTADGKERFLCVPRCVRFRLPSLSDVSADVLALCSSRPGLSQRHVNDMASSSRDPSSTSSPPALLSSVTLYALCLLRNPSQ